MSKCPSCGHEIPGVSHFGLKASPKNYLTAPIELAPGRKYIRTFSLLFYPERNDPQLGVLPPCVVIASEEYPKVEKSYPFIAGAKFYPNDIQKLSRAAEDVMLAELAFRALIYGRQPHTLLHSRLRTLYHSPGKREQLHHRLQSIHSNMVICRDVTARESSEEWGVQDE